MQYKPTIVVLIAALAASATAIPTEGMVTRNNPNDDHAHVSIFSNDGCTADKREFDVTGDGSHRCINVSNMRGLTVQNQLHDIVV
ncbi:hypothetical protein N0V90_005231 [Kalmusia sp. IMI 367209]|nr:hypothetical protein N0V90_005231 [Kalmusia sp. IMI 367209]